jgi:hypothetical protein
LNRPEREFPEDPEAEAYYARKAVEHERRKSDMPRRRTLMASPAPHGLNELQGLARDLDPVI